MAIMGMYQIPPDVKEKEKVIGGILNLVQFLWLLGGLGLALLLFLATSGITGSLIVGLISALLGIGVSLPFAFYKKRDLSFFQYLKFKRRLKNKNVCLVNKRKDVK